MQNTYNADSITVLEGLEAVRRRPGMYIGSVGQKGLNHLIYEIVDNSVDEHMAGFCDKIFVTLNKDGSCTVTDNGRGIPVELHQKGVSAERVVLTTLHAGGKFDTNSYKTSGGLHGVGSSVVNALSLYLNIRISRNGKIYEDKYEKGVPVQPLKNGLLPVVGKSTSTGTEITFAPDPEIFENTTFKSEWLKTRLHETCYLNPNLEIVYTDNRTNEPESISYKEPDGLAAFVRELNKGHETVTPEIYFKGKAGLTEVEGCIQFLNTFDETVMGFCNTIATQEGGTHITGFKNKFASMINSYARQLGYLKDKDQNFTGADTRSGMTAVISVKYPEPVFEGQTKTKLATTEVGKDVATVTGEQLEMYLDRNIDALKAIISNALSSAKIRASELKTKNNLLTKSKYSFDSNGKLANCISKNPEECEIFIVEGDSAGGSAKTSRDRHTQAILPLRGKILNVEKASVDKVLSNAEIKTMINAFGCGFSEGYGNDFDITKLRYNKIIFMTDADVDGAHIDTLLLTFIYRFMPELITAGHVYIACPPLYKAESKAGTVYLQDDNELMKYRKKHKDGTFKLQRYKGLGEMNPTQLWETTLNPENRTLMQVTINDMAEATFTTELLMGTEVAPRKAFIQNNAQNAEVDS